MFCENSLDHQAPPRGVEETPQTPENTGSENQGGAKTGATIEKAALCEVSLSQWLSACPVELSPTERAKIAGMVKKAQNFAELLEEETGKPHTA